MLDPKLRQSARIEARSLLRWLYEEREAIWRIQPSPLEMIEPSVVIERLLGIHFLEPEEILIESELYSGEQKFHYAGYMDRSRREIAVAQRFRLEIRRFTAAHEIGHWLLHPGSLYFRDFPMEGGERVERTEELQANVFAAEFLMPRKLLCRSFFGHFGIDSLAEVRINEGLAARLSTGTGRSVKTSDLIEKGLRFRSELFAESLPFDGREPVLSLAKLFRVSPIALAIQLEDLMLVI